MKSRVEKPVIIFISNRFGYGPTMTLLHVIRKCLASVDADLVFAGSGICMEAFDVRLKSTVACIEIDERNIDEVRELIKRYGDRRTYVVSCLNRFAIQAAKELNVANALIDFLTWMWNKIPDGYEAADLYFSNHFGTENRRPAMIEVPLILGPIPERTDLPKEYLLFNIGGTQNHLVPGVPENYLTLLSHILNSLRIPKGLKVVVAGGSEAIKFLKDRSTRPEFRIESLSSEEYISIQRRSRKIVSLAGTNSTFMSFVLGLSVVFLLPQLYAHWKLTLFLKERGYISNYQHWDDYLDVPADVNFMTEKDSIYLIESLSVKAHRDTDIFRKIVSDLQATIDGEIDTAGQDRFIADMGLGGEDVVWNHLKARWFS